MKPGVKEREVDLLLDKYIEVQAERDHYQNLLSRAEQRLTEFQKELYGDGSSEHWTVVLQLVQSRIQAETDQSRKKRCVYLAMLITGWMESVSV